MKLRAKKLWSTVVTTLYAGGLIAGLVVDVPQAISNNAHKMPGWIRHPDFWWVVIIGGLAAICLWAIWKAPAEEDAILEMMIKDRSIPIRY